MTDEELLREQILEVTFNYRVTCKCQNTFDIREMYKCYFCGIWLCKGCANEHFSKDEDVPEV